MQHMQDSRTPEQRNSSRRRELNFVNFYFNDQNLGVYAIEESFSKDLLF